jgi:hypothetical protein
MQRAFVIWLGVSLAAVAWGNGHHPTLAMPIWRQATRPPQVWRHPVDAPLPRSASELLTRFIDVRDDGGGDDQIRRVQASVLSALENAQHLGMKDRNWLWVMPSLGQINGASVRIDLP